MAIHDQRIRYCINDLKMKICEPKPNYKWNEKDNLKIHIAIEEIQISDNNILVKC